MSSRLVCGLALVAFAAALPIAASAQVQSLAQSGPATQQQGGPPYGQRRGGPFLRALRSLDLSDQQKSQIRSIMQSYRQKNQGADQATRRANNQQMRNAIMNVLTPAQRTQFQQQLQQLRRPSRNGTGQPQSSGT
jgi:Spy/CpxP family protein refolding chaperone